MHFVSQITLPPSEPSRVTASRVFQQLLLDARARYVHILIPGRLQRGSQVALPSALGRLGFQLSHHRKLSVHPGFDVGLAPRGLVAR
jgi:hypothetical protein